MDIFVAKLSSDTNADHLAELFSQFGSVISTKVIIDKETGRSKCYGFVEMENETEANTAIERLNNFEFMGKELVVKKSEPRPGDRHMSNRRLENKHYRKHFSPSNESDGRRNFNRERNFNRYE